MKLLLGIDTEEAESAAEAAALKRKAESPAGNEAKRPATEDAATEDAGESDVKVKVEAAPVESGTD